MPHVWVRVYLLSYMSHVRVIVFLLSHMFVNIFHYVHVIMLTKDQNRNIFYNCLTVLHSLFYIILLRLNMVMYMS